MASGLCDRRQSSFRCANSVIVNWSNSLPMVSLYRNRVDHRRSAGSRRESRAAIGICSPESLTNSSQVVLATMRFLTLGEIAPERGEYQTARKCWERISPQLRTTDGLPLWLALRASSSNSVEKQLGRGDPADVDDRSIQSRWLAYPDTDLDLADVRARLVLASLMEGSLDRAKSEFKSIVELHSDSVGRLAGREGLYRETLAALLNDATQWPVQPNPDAASTFAGDATRNFVARGKFALRGLAWPERSH